MNQKAIYIEAYGCALNISDYEEIANQLYQHGYSIVDDPKLAKKVMIHTCTVKAPTIDRMYSRIKEFENQGKEVIVSGCLAKTDKKRLASYTLIPPDKISDALHLIDPKNTKKKEKEKLRKNKAIEIIGVCQGCVGQCTYCKVKFARGTLISRSIASIKKQLKDALKEDIHEIWLTAQDMGCYGFDIGTNLIELLDELITVEGNFKIRLGMINPNFAYEYLKDLKRIFRSDKMYQFIHIPLQSGSNKVLSAMKRQYKVHHFKKISKSLRKQNPLITIATDIITGFPGETEKDFSKTLSVLKKTSPEVINISRFWSLKGTEAHEFENKIPQEIIRRRTKELTTLFYQIAEKENQKWNNWEGQVYIDEKGKENSMIGRNTGYRPIILKDNKIKLERFYNVKITHANTFDLEAKLIE